MAAPSLKEIEDAIIDAIKDALPYVRTCDSLSAFQADEILKDAQLNLRCPAVYVVYERGLYDHRMSGVQDRRMVFNVVTMTQNYRSGAAARHGKGAEKGTYDLLEDVRRCLTNSTCGLEIDPLLPIEENAVGGTAGVAIYGIAFETSCRFIL